LDGKTKDRKPKTFVLPQTSEEAAEATVAAVHKKYNKSLKKYIKRRLDTPEDVDDVLEGVYQRLLKHPRLSELKFSLVFLKKIAANLLIDRFRRHRLRKQEMHEILDETILWADSASPDNIIQTMEGIAVYNEIFENLSGKCRRAFILSRFKGYTHEEIADEMVVPKSAVDRYVSKVLLELGDIFDDYI